MSSTTEETTREIKLEKREFLKENLKETVCPKVKKNATETQEQREARLRIWRVQTSEYRVRQQARETPEQTTVRRALDAEKRRKRTALKRAAKIEQEERKMSETPQEKAVRLAIMRKKYRKPRPGETPENFAARHVLANGRQNRRQQKYRANLYATETPEQRETRLLIAREKRRKRREKRLAMETPEQAAARYAIAAERKRKRIEKGLEKRANETPEERTVGLEIWKEKGRKFQAERRATETLEQTAARLARTAERILLLRGAKKNAAGHISAKSRIFQQEDIDGNFNSSCTFSSLGPSEGDCSIYTTEGSFSILTTTDEFSLSERNSEEATVVKNEVSQDSWSCFDGSESSSVAKAVFGDNRVLKTSQVSDCRSFASNEETWRDKIKTAKEKTVLNHNLPCAQIPSADGFLVYGKCIADGFRQCGRHDTEINYAKALIDNIMLNLSSGVYSYLIPDKSIGVVENETAESLSSFAVVAPIQQDIIVKEEVDL